MALERGNRRFNLDIFANISPESWEVVNHIITERSYETSHNVLFQNDWGESVYFIIEGWVKIRMFHRDGHELTLNILGPDEVVGEMASMDESPRSTDVIALTPLKMAIIPRDLFLQLMQKEPSFSSGLLALLARRLRQANRRLLIRESNSECRLIDALLFIAEGQGRTSRDGVVIPAFPHRELAALSGLARETVTRILSDLQKRGLLEKVGNTMRIPSLDQLDKLLGY